MAKRRKGSDLAAPSSGHGHHRVNIGIEQAENGAVVHLSTERGGKNPSYESKTMVAPDHDAAARIAVSHIATMSPKMKKKAGKKGESKAIGKQLIR